MSDLGPPRMTLRVTPGTIIAVGIHRVGTKKMTIMDFPEILPLCQFESESNEFYGYSYIQMIVFMLSMIVI